MMQWNDATKCRWQRASGSLTCDRYNDTYLSVICVLLLYFIK